MKSKAFRNLDLDYSYQSMETDKTTMGLLQMSSSGSMPPDLAGRLMSLGFEARNLAFQN